ncbi:TPA: hypothetical protein HA351_01240 [Methanosarcinaceae archaeon]|nr:hypothetical protein [Methanosarcinaceae archaeon]
MSLICDYASKALFCITIIVLFIILLDLYLIWQLLELAAFAGIFLLKTMWSWRIYLALILCIWLLISFKDLV